MAAALNDQQIAAVEQQLTAHPEILQALRENQQKIGGRARYQVRPGTPGFMQDASRILQQYGINFPDIEDYQIQVDPTGQVHLDRQNWFQRNLDWIVPVATIGGGAAAGFASGGSSPAATGTGGSMAGVGPVAAGGGTTAATVPSSLAAAGGGGLSFADVLKKIALAGAPTAAGLTTHALTSGSQPQAPQVPPELQQLLALSLKRMTDQQPLVDRVQAQHLAGLPRLS